MLILHIMVGTDPIRGPIAQGGIGMVQTIPMPGRMATGTMTGMIKFNGSVIGVIMAD